MRETVRTKKVWQNGKNNNKVKYSGSKERQLNKENLAGTHEDTVFARISPSCRHCLRHVLAFLAVYNESLYFLTVQRKGFPVMGKPFDYNGRGEVIRTLGLLVPNQARYQTAPRPEL